MASGLKTRMCETPAVPNKTLPKTTTGLMPRPVFVFRPWCANLQRRLRIMSATTATPLLRVRVRAENPNHHLWNNHGTWFIHYTVHPTPFTKERVRRSLGTPALAVARERRDAFFAHWQAQTRTALLQAVA